MLKSVKLNDCLKALLSPQISLIFRHPQKYSSIYSIYSLLCRHLTTSSGLNKLEAYLWCTISALANLFLLFDCLYKSSRINTCFFSSVFVLCGMPVRVVNKLGYGNQSSTTLHVSQIRWLSNIQVRYSSKWGGLRNKFA